MAVRNIEQEQPSRDEIALTQCCTRVEDPVRLEIVLQLPLPAKSRVGVLAWLCRSRLYLIISKYCEVLALLTRREGKEWVNSLRREEISAPCFREFSTPSMLRCVRGERRMSICIVHNPSFYFAWEGKSFAHGALVQRTLSSKTGSLLLDIGKRPVPRKEGGRPDRKRGRQVTVRNVWRWRRCRRVF